MLFTKGRIFPVQARVCYADATLKCDDENGMPEAASWHDPQTRFGMTMNASPAAATCWPQDQTGPQQAERPENSDWRD